MRSPTLIGAALMAMHVAVGAVAVSRVAPSLEEKCITIENSLAVQVLLWPAVAFVDHISQGEC